MGTCCEAGKRPVGVENDLTRGARGDTIVDEELRNDVVAMLRAPVGQVLALVEASLSIAFNAVRRGAPIRSDIANQAVPTRIQAVITRCQGQSLAPLKWWQLLLRVQCVNGLDNGTRPFNRSHLGESASGVKVHTGEAV